MISIVQHSRPTSVMMVRSLLRIRLRTTIFVLKLNRDQSHVMRSSRMRLPFFGGLARSSEAVHSFAALL